VLTFVSCEILPKGKRKIYSLIARGKKIFSPLMGSWEKFSPLSPKPMVPTLKKYDFLCALDKREKIFSALAVTYDIRLVTYCDILATYLQ